MKIFQLIFYKNYYKKINLKNEQNIKRIIQQAVTDSQIGGAFGISPGNSKQIRKIRKVLKNNKN